MDFAPSFALVAPELLLTGAGLALLLVAAWAAHSRNTHLVKGALLVAPGDVEREALRPVLPSWSPVALQRLPFASVLVGSQNDPYCTADRAQALARAWGSDFLNLGLKGHVNAESNLGDWPEGRAMLNSLMKEKEDGH